MKNQNPPLHGITVLALEHAIAAPLCTRQLAELGAKVIKIERRIGGDFARHYDTRVLGQSSHFVWTNRSKQSLTLDLKQSGARPIIDRLLARADVLVQNLAPGAADKLGLGFARLHSQYPTLIVCNISGYGSAGPYRHKKAYDLLVQAEAGVLSTTGTAQFMAKSGISIADIAAATQAHSAILAALIQRSRTGSGSEISISMLEAMSEWMGFPLYYSYNGANPPPRSGTDHASIYPYGAFVSSDQEVIMIGLQNDREWQVFCGDVLQQPAIAHDRMFHDNQARSDNREQLRQVIQDWFSTLSCTQITQQLESARIAFARVNDMQDLWQHPQLKALQRFIEVDTPAGAVQALKPPGNNSDYAPLISAVPALGEHTRPLLIWLQYSDIEIDEFYRREII